MPGVQVIPHGGIFPGPHTLALCLHTHGDTPQSVSDFSAVASKVLEQRDGRAEASTSRYLEK